jgi:CO/xanthine dehydrogenase Mo-binding subunit
MASRRLARRKILQGSGKLAIGFKLSARLRAGGSLAPATAAPALAPEVAGATRTTVQVRDVGGATVDSLLEIRADGTVTVFTGKVELGTGIRTALAQLVAEELDVPLDRVTMVMGDTWLTPDQGGTTGSKTIQHAGPRLRQAAAQARLVLLTRASERLGVPTDQLRIQDGVISVLDDPARSVPFGELVAEPFDQVVSGEEPVKPPSEHTVVGRSIPRVDLPAKLTGEVAFVQDLRLDGMLHGRVLRPRVRTPNGVGGATILNVDDGAVRELPGVVAVVQIGSFVGIVAEREEQAIRAAERLRVTWSEPKPLPDQGQLFELMPEMPHEAVEIARDGDVERALAGAERTLEATYEFASHAHASLGPSCAVADVRPDGATVYSSSQNVFSLAASLAPLLGLAQEQVRVIHAEGAGCYGHNGSDDVSADAALLSQAVGRPVRVQWERADEFAWEPKAPAMRSRLRGGLDAAGNVVAWDYEVWTPTHTSRPNGEPSRLLAGELVDPHAPPAQLGRTGGDRNALHTYAFPNNRVSAHWIAPPLRPGSLRSLGGMANTTANEGFVDELAAAAGADPVEFRLRHLVDPRAIDVVRRAADAAGWETRPSGPDAPGRTPAPAGNLPTGRGIAFARYEARYTYVAVVAEVEVDPRSGAVRVARIVVAHDCGLIVNPDGVRNQVEGNVIQGISRALKEEVTFDRTGVTSLDFSTYRILTFAEVPTIVVELIDRPDEPPLGAGEPAICPVAAAIGNAVFDATGARLRTVPYTPGRVLATLEARGDR